MVKGKSESDAGMMRPEDIRSDKANLQWLILKQMDRVNYLMSVAQASKQDYQGRINLINGIESGLRCLESMLFPSLPETYFKRMKRIKAELKLKYKRIYSGPKGVKEYLTFLSDWYDLLVSQLGATGLLPTEEIDVYIDDEI